MILASSQFFKPEVPNVEEKYTKKWFQKRGTNIRAYLKEHRCNIMIDPDLGEDLISNCMPPEYIEFIERPKVEISKIFHFAAAHFLPDHKGKCQFLHGHEWKLEVVVKRATNATGMVLDYSVLKQIVNRAVIDEMDHAFINHLVPNPTAENLLIAIWNMLQYKGRLKGIHALHLWEAPDSKATLTAKDMANHVEGMWKWL